MSDYYEAQDISEIVEEISSRKERLIMEQLGDFVAKGLIEVQATQPVLTTWRDPSKPPGHDQRFEMRQTVKLVLKDREYITRLEDEVAALKKVIENIRQANKDLGVALTRIEREK